MDIWKSSAHIDHAFVLHIAGAFLLETLVVGRGVAINLTALEEFLLGVEAHHNLA
jgi:hypothetical protein